MTDTTNNELPVLTWDKDGDFYYAPNGYIVREGEGTVVAALSDQHLAPILAASTEMLAALELVRDTIIDAKDMGMVPHPLRSKLNAMEQRVDAAITKARATR